MGNNILTISGTGRNVGKTSLACRIIRKVSTSEKLTAIKISPHPHKVDYPKALFEKPGAYSMFRENKKDRGKDSSKMLAAGADSAYYVQTSDAHLADAWEKLSEIIDKDRPVVIESGGLDGLLDPGLSIIVTDPEFKDKKNRRRSGSDKVETSFEKFDQILNNIAFYQGSWKLNN